MKDDTKSAWAITGICVVASLLFVAGVSAFRAPTPPPLPSPKLQSPRDRATSSGRAMIMVGTNFIDTNNVGIPVHWPITDISFKWDNESNFTSWHARWGLTTNYTRNVFVPVPMLTITNVTNGTVIHFSVAGINLDGVEGNFSPDLVVVAPANTPLIRLRGTNVEIRATVTQPGWIQQWSDVRQTWFNVMPLQTNMVNSLSMPPVSPSNRMFFRLNN